MLLDLTDEEAATLERELDDIIEHDRYFLSPRIQTLKAIRSKIRPEPEREPAPPRKPLRAAESDGSQAPPHRPLTRPTGAVRGYGT